MKFNFPEESIEMYLDQPLKIINSGNAPAKFFWLLAKSAPLFSYLKANHQWKQALFGESHPRHCRKLIHRDCHHKVQAHQFQWRQNRGGKTHHESGGRPRSSPQVNFITTQINYKGSLDTATRGGCSSARTPQWRRASLIWSRSPFPKEWNRPSGSKMHCAIRQSFRSTPCLSSLT